MTRYGMLINTKKCVGCSACRIACQMKNHLDPEESFIKYHEIETGEYPNVYNEIVPTQCMHCEDAPCAAVCPTHATYITRFRRGAGGRGKVHRLQVLHGCVSLRARIVQEKTGVVEKCRFCWDGENRAIRRRAWEPAFRVRASSAIWTTRIARSTRLSRNTTHSRSLTT